MSKMTKIENRIVEFGNLIYDCSEPDAVLENLIESLLDPDSLFLENLDGQNPIDPPKVAEDSAAMAMYLRGKYDAKLEVLRTLNKNLKSFQ